MRFRLSLKLTGCVIAGVAILVGLGNWQWRRLGEKEAFLASLRSQIDAVPIPLPASPVAMTRVKLEGMFLTDLSLPVHATLPAPERGKSLGGLGFWWVTPLQMSDGRIVLVNRGFVPAGQDNLPIVPPAPTGEQTVVGLTREPDLGNAFLPNDDIGRHDFFRRDATLLAPAIGEALEPVGKVVPLMVDAERSGSPLTAPVGLDINELIASIPNDHLSYAFTWWGLAVTLLAVYGAYLFSLRRKDASQS